VSGYTKLDEVPYDFVRKLLTVLVAVDGKHLMVTKGAVSNVVGVCSSVETSDGQSVDIGPLSDQIQQQYMQLSGQGFRTLGVAYRDAGSLSQITKDDETGMTFLGFVALYDPPKPDIAETIGMLGKLGVSLKVITGDNRLVAASVCQQVGLAGTKVLTGQDLNAMSDEALAHQVNQVDVFAEVEPNQKERVLLALRKSGNVVGYMGDGINDASALHAADVGISVDSAVDVAKEAADIVLLEKDLDVLIGGVQEGRRTFSNTLKYIFINTSASFGNVFSMAGASLILPFLPLLPEQVLLTNFLTDFPGLALPTDNVDPEMVDRPRRWDIKFIRNFMIVFGLQSSVFDFLTFGVLMLVFNTDAVQFRTGWFLESVISELLILLVVRTPKPFLSSRPGKYLTIASLVVGVITLLLPYSPLGGVLGFTPVPLLTLLALLAILALYITTAEIVKRFFYKVVKF
jgi:Mg2+-importing ATPase